MRKKKKTFSSTTSTPFPPNPKETAGIGPRGAVLLGTLWERDETRGRQMRETREEASKEILWLKKKNCWWLWNITRKKKTCGSFCHFLFLFDVIINVYFRGSIFPRWRSVFDVPFLRMLSLCCFFFLLFFFLRFLILWFVWFTLAVHTIPNEYWQKKKKKKKKNAYSCLHN